MKTACVKWQQASTCACVRTCVRAARWFSKFENLVIILDLSRSLCPFLHMVYRFWMWPLSTKRKALETCVICFVFTSTHIKVHHGENDCIEYMTKSGGKKTHVAVMNRRHRERERDYKYDRQLWQASWNVKRYPHDILLHWMQCNAFELDCRKTIMHGDWRTNEWAKEW